MQFSKFIYKAAGDGTSFLLQVLLGEETTVNFSERQKSVTILHSRITELGEALDTDYGSLK
jgi:hypothetical protein